MPKQDYRRKRLSRLHTNELFRQIESSGIPVTGFELTQRTAAVSLSSKSLLSRIINPSSESYPVTVIDHSSSRSNFQTMQLGEDIFICRSLTDSGISIEEELNLEWIMRRWDWRGWTKVRDFFGEWLEEIKVIEDSQKDPDLWEELKGDRTFLGEQHEQNVENTPFTVGEQAEVSAQIKQVKDYIRATSELTSEQMAHVDARFDQAEQASRRMGRKDWLLLFNGAVFSLILTDLITPQAAEHIIMLTVHGLGHLFGFGGPPPHLPPGR
jgi:hypothetical protein